MIYRLCCDPSYVLLNLLIAKLAGPAFLASARAMNTILACSCALHWSLMSSDLTVIAVPLVGAFADVDASALSLILAWYDAFRWKLSVLMGTIAIV